MDHIPPTVGRTRGRLRVTCLADTKQTTTLRGLSASPAAGATLPVRPA